MIYLLHFDKPISPAHTCRHYLGYTDDLQRRIAEHRAGTGARLVQVANERGIGFEVVRVWRGDRGQERKLKNRKEGPTLCPICNPGKAHRLACAGGILPASILEGDDCPF
jgi:hypothetical protein